MEFSVPILHYFQRKNQYSGAKNGMRYLFEPTTKKYQAEDGSEVEEKILALHIWPDPWALERTDPALCEQYAFAFTEDGRTQAIEQLAHSYAARQEEWENCPNIVDAAPWYPAPELPDEAEGDEEPKA